MINIAHGYAAHAYDTPMVSYTFERREVRANDVQVAVLFSGVCHSDMHTVHNDWGGGVFPNGTIYPSVPGHEIIGRVTAVGPACTKYKVGEVVGVGNMVDSCLECSACTSNLECYCEKSPTWTFNAPDRVTGENTLGGYSDLIVVREDFVFRIAHKQEQLRAVAPLLCAGITMWSPLHHWNIGRGKKVGIVGIGGLGHMGLKLASALGAHVVAFTTSIAKIDDAFRLGANEVVTSGNPSQMALHASSLDLIIDTVAVPHDLTMFLNLLRLDGTLTLVGIPAEPHPSPSVVSLIGRRRNLAGSLVGGVRETQEMLNFCAIHEIVADVEMITLDQVEVAFARMVKNDIKYRFVIDMKASLETEARGPRSDGRSVS